MPLHTDTQLHALMEAICQRYSYDFRNYSLPSQRRRLNQALERFACADLPALQQLVLDDPAAFGKLLQMLTVPVTQMFRDPAFFLAVRQHVVPVLKTYPSPTIWVAGCCTGEEALSLAIVLHEEGLLERSTIYATDINPQALATAARGAYRLQRLSDYGDNYLAAGGLGRLADYYTVEHATAQFDQRLLDRINFADHSLSTDSVFIEAQLILCRNVLIYFNKTLQERALGLFHDALCHRGFLGLGSKESTHFTRFAVGFDPLPGAEKLYRKRALSHAAPPITLHGMAMPGMKHDN